MNSEREHEQKWGKSIIGPYIVFEIDSILRTNRSKEPAKPGPRFRSTINMIISQLVIDKVPFETLEHLKVSFRSPEESVLRLPSERAELKMIKEVLSVELGQEVVKRLELSIEEAKVRTLPH